MDSVHWVNFSGHAMNAWPWPLLQACTVSKQSGRMKDKEQVYLLFPIPNGSPHKFNVPQLHCKPSHMYVALLYAVAPLMLGD